MSEKIPSIPPFAYFSLADHIPDEGPDGIEHIVQPGCEFLICRRDNRKVGVMIHNPEIKPPTYVGEVHPDYRRQKVATEVIEYADKLWGVKVEDLVLTEEGIALFKSIEENKKK